MTLDEYIRKIDRILQVKCGAGLTDKEIEEASTDYDFVSAYEDGETPSSVAKQILENEGFTM